MLFETILSEYFLLPCITDVIATVSNSVIFSAVFSTFLIATDRFYAVTSPLHYSMTITRSRSQVMIVLAWLSGLALALPYVLFCTVPQRNGLHKSLHIIFTILQTAIGYLFPFVGLCWLYLRMYHAAHRNSERTRKHSISGELLTVMDGSTSVIPQGIDFLTHYMNPFTRTPMAGSVQPVGNGHQQERNSIGPIVPVVVKKTRRRSSNGSSSSLLFREEGRAIKTAFFVLASFFVCWTPHFVLLLINEISDKSSTLEQFIVYENVSFVGMDSSLPELMTSSSRRGSVDGIPHPSNGHSGRHHASLSTPFTYNADWGKFLGILGMLLSSVLNPFIYVFRNKIACEEISRLLYGLFGFKLLSKEGHPVPNKEKERKTSDNGSGVSNPVMNNTANLYDNDGLPSDVSEYQPRYAPCIGKSPKRSSMKSLTPQSSINSTMTNCNSMTGGPADSPVVSRATDSSHISFANGRSSKPPFLRSLTLPEQQTQPRVKFPPNLIRQKSYASYRPQAVLAAQGSLSSSEATPANVKRAKFVRQDSVCSILSNDSVLMICTEDGMSMSEVGPLGILNLSFPPQTVGNGTCPRAGGTALTGNGALVNNSSISRVPEGDNEEENYTSQTSGSIQGTPVAKCYLRQDSNFSDASHRTNDSGVVLSSISSNKQSTDTSSGHHIYTPEHCRIMRHLSPSNSPVKPPTTLCKKENLHGHHNGHSHHPTHGGHRKHTTNIITNNHHSSSIQDANNKQASRHNPVLLQTSI